jgi:hypothetical protein
MAVLKTGQAAQKLTVQQFSLSYPNHGSKSAFCLAVLNLNRFVTPIATHVFTTVANKQIFLSSLAISTVDPESIRAHIS